jgi:cytochrome c553
MNNRISISVFASIVISFFGFNACAQPDGAALYQQYCATCHGVDLKGGNGGSLVDGIWQFGAADSYKFRNVKFGITHLGMPSYDGILKDDDIRAIMNYVSDSEKNAGAVKPAIVKEFETLDYKLNVEVFAEGLEIPWAIDFLDVNTALITEKPGRLRVVTKGKLQP